MSSDGKPLDFEEADPDDDLFGVGKIEDFTWKGMLDFATCTECGRCQSQCPAWNTGKPLSPKLLIMDLRDHLYAKAPYLLGARTAPEDDVRGLPRRRRRTAARTSRSRATRGSMGTTPSRPTARWSAPPRRAGSSTPTCCGRCTTCGACVEQCPVDIEHVDHIIDMRRYQVLIESSFPAEAGVMLRNLENKGNPWG